jgi:eukaryotic-like serine/threonine-protein kinase
MVPPKIRGYAVERLLGSGGSGEVWQARIADTNTRVALKRIAIRDDEQLRRAHSEAALLAALDHPNLVRLHSLITVDDAAVLVLDLAAGGSLARLLEARGRLAVGEVSTLAASIGAALAYLHDQGVVHGDVSAGNVLFTESGIPLLADVGVARLTGDDSDAQATSAYVDPAVAAGCVPGPQSDVFMLGGVALHALTGVPPWPDKDADAALERAASGVLDDVTDRLAAAGAGPATVTAICRALSMDPNRRGTAADFALDMRHSAEPVAIELDAGRPRANPEPFTAGPRHAASSARPGFARPAVNAGPTNAPPTRMVARPRPLIPRPPRRRLRPRLAVGAVAAAVVAALAVVTTAWARAGQEPAGTNRVDWVAALNALDARRSDAFASRDVSLLAKVYSSPALVAADTKLLETIIPPGCRLVGVRTRYSDVQVTQRDDRAVVLADATLTPSRLRCPGRPDRIAPGAGPTPLRFELRHDKQGVRIVAERSVSG